jgi:hypothetical protein
MNIIIVYLLRNMLSPKFQINITINLCGPGLEFGHVYLEITI